MAKRRYFSREFKQKIVRESEIKPLVEISKEHDLHPNLITRWKREKDAYQNSAFKGNGNLYKLEAQLAEKDRLIGKLYAENEFLKKAQQTLERKREEEKALRHSK